MKRTPPLGLKGVYKLKTPWFASSDVFYTCMAIRSFKDIYETKKDVFDTYYNPKGLSKEYFIQDSIKHPNIITLISDDDKIIYVPDTHIVSYTNGDLVAYSRVVLSVDFGMLPDALDMSQASYEISQIGSKVIGKEPVTKIHIAPTKGQVSTVEHDILESARLSNIEQDVSVLNKHLRDQAKIEAMAKQLRVYELLYTGEEGYIPPCEGPSAAEVEFNERLNAVFNKLDDDFKAIDTTYKHLSSLNYLIVEPIPPEEDVVFINPTKLTLIEPSEESVPTMTSPVRERLSKLIDLSNTLDTQIDVLYRKHYVNIEDTLVTTVGALDVNTDTLSEILLTTNTSDQVNLNNFIVKLLRLHKRINELANINYVVIEPNKPQEEGISILENKVSLLFDSINKDVTNLNIHLSEFLNISKMVTKEPPSVPMVSTDLTPLVTNNDKEDIHLSYNTRVAFGYCIREIDRIALYVNALSSADYITTDEPFTPTVISLDDLKSHGEVNSVLHTTDDINIKDKELLQSYIDKIENIVIKLNALYAIHYVIG